MLKFTFMLFKPLLNSSSCVNWGIFVLENYIVVRKERLDQGIHMITQPVHVLSCSDWVMKCNNGTNRILYHDTAAQTITEHPPCFNVGTKDSGL
jgi:hypothetical protein